MRWLLVGAYLCAGIGVLLATRYHAREPFLAALDVGQGDSVLVDAGIGVMVDTGSAGSRAIEQAHAQGSRVGALVVTHLHEDHAGDVAAALTDRPAALFWNGRTDGTLYAKIAQAAGAAHVPMLALMPGDILRAGGASLTVISPDAGYRTSGDPNDTSVVLRADLPGFSVLLTGDAPAEAEARWPKALVDVDVLKVGHHGSKGSTGDALLNAATPQVALISDGKGNSYGHPAPEALTRLADHGVKIRRTDREGTLRVTAASLGR